MNIVGRSDARLGVIAMIFACVIWGVAPIYYRQLDRIPAADILAHRILWSFVFFALVLFFQGRLGRLRETLTERNQLGWVIAAAMVITLNWFFFIYSIQIGKLTEASLGYYMFPLVAVSLGFVVFRESLSAFQWFSVVLAAAAVGTLTFGLGAAPWISLLLALSFATYGVIKKKATTGSVVSVTAEVFVLLPLVVAWLIFRADNGLLSPGTLGLLMFSGPLTATPLILFSFAAQRIRLSTVGLLQYINPTMQFLIALFIFGEPVTRWHGSAFVLIWIALGIYSGVAFVQDRAARREDINSSTVGTI